MTLVPVTYVLFVLNSLRDNDLYPGLPPAANYVIAAIYIALRARRRLLHDTPNITTLGTERAGDWNSTDLFMGGLMTLLVLEYSRKRHMPLFVLNIVLMLYAVYGYVVPGMFYHAGLSWYARRHRHERRDHDRRVLQPAADRAHGHRRVPARAGDAERLWLHRIAAARHQARCDPLAARAAAVGGDRLDVRRHRQRQRRGQRHHHRLRHHSGDDRRRHAAGDRGRDRVRAPRSAAS